MVVKTRTNTPEKRKAAKRRTPETLWAAGAEPARVKPEDLSKITQTDVRVSALKAAGLGIGRLVVSMNEEEISRLEGVLCRRLAAAIRGTRERAYIREYLGNVQARSQEISMAKARLAVRAKRGESRVSREPPADDEFQSCLKYWERCIAQLKRTKPGPRRARWLKALVDGVLSALSKEAVFPVTPKASRPDRQRAGSPPK